MKYLLVSALIILSAYAIGPRHNKDTWQQVLEANKIGKEFKFFDPKDSTETYLKYLGKIKSDQGIAYKILTSSFIWGMSHRASSRILVFNTNNKYLGNYYVTMTTDLPDRISNNCLYFSNLKKDGCDPRVITSVSFKKGIPKHFFLKCTVVNLTETGDIYTFDTSN